MTRAVALLCAAGILCLALPVGSASADSLFRQTASMKNNLIAKRSDFQVGDVITVLVNESIESSVISNINTKKESDVESKADAASNEFLVAKGPDGLDLIPKEQLPNWKIEAENELKARGQTRRQTELATTITCLVTAVYDNGTLAIEGSKAVSINREESRLNLSGLVRARDVTPANTISSKQVANPVIQLKGKGPLWNNQRRGIFTRILDWFSPF